MGRIINIPVKIAGELAEGTASITEEGDHADVEIKFSVPKDSPLVTIPITDPGFVMEVVYLHIPQAVDVSED